MRNIRFLAGDTRMFLSILRGRQIFAKRPRLAAFVFGLWVLLTVFSGTPAMAQQNVVVVRPKEIHDVLVNPDMGITTFQRFNGQEPNPPLKWSEVGPVAKLPQAPTKPDFPDTSISYAVFCLKKKKY